MRVVVVGAGIGGCAAAIALHRAGHEVAVLERVAVNRPVGAAISVWPNGVHALHHLGQGAAVGALAGPLHFMSYREGRTGTTMCRFPLAPVTAATGHPPCPVVRADLQAALMAAAGHHRIRLGAAVERVEQDAGSATAVLADGERVTGDVLVAADGARSALREHVTGAPVPRRYAGYVNHNGLVPVDPAIGPPDQWTQYVADGRRVSVMPVAGERFYFFLDVPGPADPDVGATDPRAAHAALVGHFVGWAPGVRRLLDAIDPATTNRVPIHDTDPLPTWVRGRVALLGDAAHPTTPDIGQGGCLALEDAVVLGRELAGAGGGDVPAALRRYQDARIGRATALVLRARRRSDVTHGTDPAATAAWYEQLRGEDGSRVVRGLVANVEGHPLR